MLCSRCNKRMAVVFVSADKNTPPQGLCTVCAKELGLSQVNDIMEKMGITDEMLEAASEQMQEFMENQDDDSEEAQNLRNMMQQAVNLNDIPNLMKDGEFNPEALMGEDFQPGGAQTFPESLKSLFGEGFGGDLAKKDDAKKEETGDKSKPKEHNKKNFKYLNVYCEHLTGKARANELDRIIGRDKEIERTIQILSRRTKNNPCLIGEPGVGKTAIAEGLAIKIASKDVPSRLQDKEVYLLDLTALVAGTQFRGQFESRIKGLIGEVKQEGNIILFIDEVHTLVGTGDNEGTMNAANILKPALSRGEIQVIGATTFNEYRKYIEKDTALERRFQTVTVAEPSIEETVEVLVGIKDYYELFHRVNISNKLIKKAVVLSERYINDRFLPDKAIDLLDEACTGASLRNKDITKYDKLVQDLKETQMEEERVTATASENDETPDFEKLAMLHAKKSQIEKEIEYLSPIISGVQVTEEDLAKVIELWTGIPASRIREAELRRLANLDETLKKFIIGQDEGVEALAAAIRRSRVNISPRKRPASFIFVGSTGVGKTELVKVLAKELFDTPETLIRLDMSEFMEKHAASKIIGSPPGYVGYDEAGQVTEKVRRRPYSVILFDEIEKAHPDVMNILLQILDEGAITDSHGRKVDFSNTVVIMTSNAGSDNSGTLLGFGKTQSQGSKDKVLKALSEFLRPEFLSRVDEIIVFNNLDIENFKDIAKLMLEEYVESLKENKEITFSYSSEVVELIANKAFGGRNGARDLRGIIRHDVEDAIASRLIEEGEDNISLIKVTTAKDENDKEQIVVNCL